MADSKYGQLFTEADVRLLMAFAYLEGRDGKSYGQDAEGNAMDRGAHLLAEWQRMADDPQEPFDLKRMLAFPADEPLFLLRGQDVAAGAALHGYDEGLSDLGLLADSPHRADVARTIRAFEQFRDDHPERIKVPD